MAPVPLPEWLHTVDRLASVQWCRHVGQPLPPELAEWCAPVATSAEASRLFGSETWEAWSLGNHNLLTGYLDHRHHRRYQDWRSISGTAKEIYSRHEAAIAEGLERAGLTDAVHRDAMRWDVVTAMVCAGFADCHPPQTTLMLLDVYVAGHVPVGFDVTGGKVRVY